MNRLKASSTLRIGFALLLSLVCGWANAIEPAAEQNRSQVVAVLPFTASGAELEDLAVEVPELLSVFLSNRPSLMLVERGDVQKALSELELSLSGATDPESAVRVGYLTGAQVLISGRVFPVQNELVVVAKIIGVETGRVYGTTVTMPASGSIVEASTRLAESVAKTLQDKGETLVANIAPQQDLVSKLKRYTQNHKLPSVSVVIVEQSLGRKVPDPAAETEVAYILKALGFRVLDPATAKETADIEIVGEAFSEFGLRKANLVSSKGRIELKSIHPATGEVLFVDRAVAVAVDLSPEIAGKKALSKAAGQLTERLVPALTQAR